MNEAEALLQGAYRAFNARDIDSALAAMHPDVDWHNAMEDRRAHGHDEVRAYWTRQWELIDPHVEPLGFETEADDRVAVEVHQVVRDLDGNVIADQRVRHLYAIRDGLIERMDAIGP